MGDGQRYEDSWNLLANQSGFVGEFSASWKVVVGVSHQNKAKTKQNKGTKGKKEEGKGKKKKKRRGGCCLGTSIRNWLWPPHVCNTQVHLHVWPPYVLTYVHLQAHKNNKTFKKSHQFHYKSNEWAMKPNLTLWVRLVHEASHCLSLQKSKNRYFSPLFSPLSTSLLLLFFLVIFDHGQ